MNKILICNTCKGQKKIYSMGMIKVDCKNCNGIGFIKNKNCEYKDDDMNYEDICIKETCSDIPKNLDKPTKKRGRPMKIKSFEEI